MKTSIIEIITKINSELNPITTKEIFKFFTNGISSLLDTNKSSLRIPNQEILEKIKKEYFDVSIDNIFTIVVYDKNEKYEPKNSSNNYGSRGIRQQFTDYEKLRYFSDDDDNKHFYTFIGICNHGNIIEVGKSHFPLSDGDDGDWVIEVKLKDSNINYMDHIISNIVDRDDIKGRNIKKRMNEDYKYIVFIPISNNDSEDAEQSALHLENILKTYFNEILDENTYLDKVKNKTIKI